MNDPASFLRIAYDERPLPSIHRQPPPIHYFLPDDALLHAAESAILLGLPLILAGEPGVGKTAFASALAAQLDVIKHETVSVSSTSSSEKLKYEIDEVSRFKSTIDAPIESYIRVSPLLRAIMWSQGSDSTVRVRRPGETSSSTVTLADLFPSEFVVQGEARKREVEGSVSSIVLLDEFDKAPRSTANDLLHVIEHFEIEVHELGIRIAARPENWPILIITTNEEQQLPEPLLRRCVFHEIQFPSQESRFVEKIVATHMIYGAMDPDEIRHLDPLSVEVRGTFPMIDDVCGILYQVRSLDLERKPTIADAIMFARLLIGKGFSMYEELPLADANVIEAARILGKTGSDISRIFRTFPRQRVWAKGL